MLGAAGVILLRRRGGDRALDATEDDAVQHAYIPAPVPGDVTYAAAAAPLPANEPADEIAGQAHPLVERACIEIDCIATRAGTNLTSAAVEYTIVARNVGDVIATGIRLDIRLLTMGTRHDALLDALFAMPVDQSIAAPFDLPPGTAVDLGGMAMHPKDTIETIDLGGRTMVVPLLAINLRYRWPNDGAGQTARAFVIGIDRGAGAKLQPFRLDDSARMSANVAVIAYSKAVII